MSYYFKLPTYDDLNAKQKVAVSDMGPIAISGGPGTGKSVVAVWRHILNYENNRRRSILLTYTKSLRYFLAKSVQSYSQIEESTDKKRKILNAFNTVAQANSWEGSEFDEIIIDEAQDLPEHCIIAQNIQQLINGRSVSDKIETRSVNTIPASISNSRTQLIINGKSYPIGKWVEIENGNKRYMLYGLRNSVRYIARFSQKVSYGADDNQILYPERATTEAQLASIFSIPADKKHKLHVNYRNTYEILNYVKYTLSYDIKDDTLERLRLDESRRGLLPVLKLVQNYSEQNKLILEIIEDFNDDTANIAIFFPFMAQVKEMCNYMIQKGYTLFGTGENSFSSYSSQDEEFRSIDNVHVTTFKSSKGLEFDVVIIPFFGYYREYIDTKYVVNDEDYYVAYTRAKTNLFLISDTDLDITSEVLNREEFVQEITSSSSLPSFSDDLPF